MKPGTFSTSVYAVSVAEEAPAPVSIWGAVCISPMRRDAETSPVYFAMEGGRDLWEECRI